MCVRVFLCVDAVWFCWRRYCASGGKTYAYGNCVSVGVRAAKQTYPFEFEIVQVARISVKE